jgi:cell division protein FtsW
MIAKKRGDYFIRRWLWSIDSVLLLLIITIIGIGALLVATASPAVAERLGLHSFYFVHRQLIFLSAAIFIIIILSICSEKTIKRVSLLGFAICLLFMLLTLFIGDEVKGAVRWVTIKGFSLQPSEFLKPFYIVICASLLAERYTNRGFPSFRVCSALHLIVLSLLLLQPDFGMAVVMTVVLISQFFLAGLSMAWIIISGIIAIIATAMAYTYLPHVTKRINSFLYADNGANYQVDKSLESYVSGGLFGKGPGEGIVKTKLPDSHADFIFSVAGEEFGAIITSLIIFLFFITILRALSRVYKENSLFNIYTASGIIILFAMHVIFNIGMTMKLFPTKGMTLPFASYGGSSTLSFAICMGILLSITKRKDVWHSHKTRKSAAIQVKIPK